MQSDREAVGLGRRQRSVLIVRAAIAVSGGGMVNGGLRSIVLGAMRGDETSVTGMTTGKKPADKLGTGTTGPMLSIIRAATWIFRFREEIKI